MMSYPLTLPHLLERAGRYFANSEIVSRLPDHYMFLDALPRTSTGKFLKRALRQRVATEMAAEGERSR